MKTAVVALSIVLSINSNSVADIVENYSGHTKGSGVNVVGQKSKTSKQIGLIPKLIDRASEYQEKVLEKANAPVATITKISLPYCTNVSETDALDLGCMQTDIGVCPGGEYLMVEYTVGANNIKTATGNQWCSATNEVEAAPGTVVEAAQPIEIVVTLRDLQRLDVGASKILSGNMKRDGKYVGLRKRPIHMWTEAGVVNRSITMFGRNVQVRLTPVSYNWSFGDGTSQKAVAQESRADSPSSGKVRTSHSYTDTGTYDAQVTVNYAGQFRVGDEDWVPVVGILEIPSETASMDIWRKKVYPVADDCDANPQGWGCDSLFQETKPHP